MSGGNGGKKRWSSSIDQKLVDPTGTMEQPPVLPGYQGVPYRGPARDIKSDDPEHIQPEIRAKVHIQILDLSKQDDVDEYTRICQVIANGYGQLSKEDMQYDKRKKNWRVFVRWLELFATPKGARNGSIG